MPKPYIKPPCEKCGLRYSSYCIGCRLEYAGLGYSSILEWLKAKKEAEQHG